MSAPSYRVARPGVLRHIPLDRHVVIEASAGTGKTFTLENLVVELVLSADLTLDQLLCVTFTEKATHEIRARVRAKLRSLLAGGDGARAGGDGDSWTIDDRARRRLERALHSFDAATIATIHAFCHRVLKENAFASGRCFEERQVDGREAFGRALRDALRGDVARDPVGALWLEGALRCGWSIGMIEELLWKCAKEHAPLRPSFDAAALDAALEAFPVEEARHPRLLGELKAVGVHSSTAGSLVRAFGEMADLVEQARSPGGVPWFVREAQKVASKFRDKLPAVSARPGPSARVVASSLAIAQATPPFAAAVVQALIGPVRTELARSKRAAGRYDFDDMLALVDEALRGPRGPALAEAMRRRWRFALIDEFQDTDETQWSIFRRAFARGGRDASSVLVLVGDPKQSIYRFRGADVDTYLAASREVLAGGGERVRLEHNFRATPALVEATNRVFDRDVPEPVFTGEVTYAPVACGRPDRVLVDGDGQPLAPLAALRAGSIPTMAELGAWVARETKAATDPARPWRIDGRALHHGDVFVLTRTLREGREVGKALRAAGVPHSFYKEEGLFQSDEAKELRALLSAIDDPEDRARRMAAWLTPFFGLPLAEVEGARTLPPTHPLVARLYAWKALADARDFDRLFESIVTGSGIVRREIFFADGERDLTNYLHLLEILTERARGGRATLRELLQELAGLIDRTRLPLDIEGNMQRMESDRRAVQIMTIHKAKGLEAAVVFVTAMNMRRSDDVRVYHEGGHRLAWVGTLAAEVKDAVEEEEAQEEQRLMYVALTRAMGRVYLPCVVDEAGGARALRGAYDSINRRVAALAQADDPLLSVEDASPALAAAVPAASPATWSPPPALLRAEDVAAKYAALRERHAPVVVTSYTRLRGEKAERGDRGERSAWAEQAEQRRAAKSGEGVDEVSPAVLKSARTSGVFLHEVLERISLASFAAAGSAPAWRGRSDVAALFDEAIAAHRIDPAQREHAEQLVWSAYTTPIELPGGEPLAGLASAAPLVREMDFVYSMEGSRADARARPGGGDAPGYVRGSLDLAFQHRGLTYFADWKSDSLASYAPDALARHVIAHYADQARLYALAVVRLLGIRSRADHEARFGGILYCFLRGLREGAGVWASRPSWEEIVTWEDDLHRTQVGPGPRRGA